VTEAAEQSVNNASLARTLRRRAPVLVVLFVTAIAFRTCGAVTAPTTPVADAADYHQLATGLAEGRGYVNSSGQETAWRPPGYPLFLSCIYRFTGPRVSVAVFVQVVIGALTVLALVLFGAMVIGWREALIAGFVAAVYPGLVWLPRLLLSENLSLLLLLATLSAAALYMKSRRLWWLGVVGFVGGLNTLVRGGNLIVLVVLCAAILFVVIRRRSPPPRQAALGVFLTLAAFAAVLVPWTVRNYRVLHSFVPVATQEGLTLYASYWPPQKNGRFIWGTLPGIEDPEVAVASQLGDEVSASRHFQSVTLQRLRANPGYFFRLIPSKMISLLVPLDWEIFPHAPGETRSINFGYIVVSLLALLGFVALKGSAYPHKWLLWVLPLVILIQAIVFYGSPRFRLPAELIAILLAAVGLSRAYAFLKSRKSLLGLKLNLFG
jgi:4-amino-4-deoxy-L-arabinose transferase-like glycosyltransferase